MKSLKVTDEVYRDLLLLKGIYHKKSMSETIRVAMERGGFNEGFFRRMELVKEGTPEE